MKRNLYQNNRLYLIEECFVTGKDNQFSKKLYSENEIFHWLLNNNSNNSCLFLTIWYCMFVVSGLRFDLHILSVFSFLEYSATYLFAVNNFGKHCSTADKSRCTFCCKHAGYVNCDSA